MLSVDQDVSVRCVRIHWSDLSQLMDFCSKPALHYFWGPIHQLPKLN